MILADVHGYWRVPGKPAAVIAWIEAHRPASSTPAVSRDGPRNHAGGGWTGWFAAFAFPAQHSGASHELLIAVTAAKGGGTALRADGRVFVHRKEPRKAASASIGVDARLPLALMGNEWKTPDPEHGFLAACGSLG